MGVEEAMQNSESVRTIEPGSVGHCEEKLGRLSPKYKKCRVSAVRDFPPGCGPFAHLNNWRPVQQAASIDSSDSAPRDKMHPPRRMVEAVRNFPPLCEINASLDARNSGREKSVMVDKTSSSKTAKTIVKQSGVGDRVQPEAHKRRAVVLGLMAASKTLWTKRKRA